ncbi:MAG TPA: hypothetical protein PLB16_11940, partial [bacterium]|nr:hypothetical protein [bacterium]
DEYGNEAGEANNISSGCDDGCEGCFSCEEEDSELLCFENGQQIADYEGLCMGEQKEYRCSGGKAEINGEIDIFIPGCSYPGCIPPWLNGFFNPAEEEFSKVGGPVWEGMLSESVIHTMEHTYQIANSFEKSYSVVKDANGNYGLYLNEFGSWVKISDVSNYPEIGRSSTLIADNVIIFAGGESINGTASNKVYALNIGSQSQTQYQTMLYSNNFVEIATLPDISNISMAVVNGYLYLMGNGSQSFHLYRLEENGFALLDNSLPKRINYSVTSDSSDIYIAGGFKCLSCTCGEKNYRDLIKFSTSNLSWTTIADKIRTDLTNVPMFKVDNKIYLANPRFRNDGKIRRIVVDVLTGEVTTDYKIPSKPNVFCLGEESSTVFGGRELSGVCTAFTEKEFESIPMGTTVKTLAGLGSELAIGTASQVKIYDIANPLSPTLLYTKGIYGPASDMLVYGNKLIVAVENGIDTIDLTTFEYTHKATYGSTKALIIYNGKLYVGDGQGIKVLHPDTLEILQQLNTSGDVKKLEIIEDVVYCYEWAGLKRFNVETLSQITTNSFNPSISEMRTYNGNLYIAISDYIQKLTFNGSSVVTANLVGDKVDLRNNFSNGYYTYFPSGNNLRVSTMEEIPEPVCGNGVIEEGELCDGNSVACTTLSDDYVDGTATCNSTCDGYNENNCEECDGWGC